MEMIIESRIYKHLAIWPLIAFLLVGVVSSPDSSRNIPVILGMFALIALGIVGSVRATKNTKAIISKVLFGCLILLYTSSFVFIVGYHAVRLTGNL
jgi:VIT1/CCC1 family predicted Fe2+/Mn2+ transporter